MFGWDDLANSGVKLITDVIDRVIPDPQAATAAKLEVLKLQQTGELAKIAADSDLIKVLSTNDQAQIDLDKTEAGGSWWQSGWRPATGWLCVVAFASNYVFLPNLTWALGLFGILTVTPPAMDMSVMLPVLLGLLGLSATRTVERLNGVAPK